MDLWTEAARDHQAEFDSSQFTRARVSVSRVWPFLAAAKDDSEFALRKAVATADIDDAVATVVGGFDGAFLALHERVIASLDADFATLRTQREAAAIEAALSTEADYHYIREHNGKYEIWQKGTGKTLSVHPSLEQAEAAFRAMESHMHGVKQADFDPGTITDPTVQQAPVTDGTPQVPVPDPDYQAYAALCAAQGQPPLDEDAWNAAGRPQDPSQVQDPTQAAPADPGIPPVAPPDDPTQPPIAPTAGVQELDGGTVDPAPEVEATIADHEGDDETWNTLASIVRQAIEDPDDSEPEPAEGDAVPFGDAATAALHREAAKYQPVCTTPGRDTKEGPVFDTLDEASQYTKDHSNEGGWTVKQITSALQAEALEYGEGAHYTPGSSLEEAIKTARDNLPIQRDVSNNPAGYVIHEVPGGNGYRVYDATPQAGGGVLPPGEQVGTPTHRVAPDGSVSKISSLDVRFAEIAEAVEDSGLFDDLEPPAAPSEPSLDDVQASTRPITHISCRKCATSGYALDGAPCDYCDGRGRLDLTTAVLKEADGFSQGLTAQAFRREAWMDFPTVRALAPQLHGHHVNLTYNDDQGVNTVSGPMTLQGQHAVVVTPNNTQHAIPLPEILNISPSAQDTQSQPPAQPDAQGRQAPSLLDYLHQYPSGAMAAKQAAAPAYDPTYRQDFLPGQNPLMQATQDEAAPATQPGGAMPGIPGMPDVPSMPAVPGLEPGGAPASAPSVTPQTTRPRAIPNAGEPASSVTQGFSSLVMADAPTNDQAYQEKVTNIAEDVMSANPEMSPAQAMLMAQAVIQQYPDTVGG